MLDRILASMREHSRKEIAASLGRSEGYVRRLLGGWRPERVDDLFYLRLEALDPTAHRRASAPAAAPAQHEIGSIPEGMDPVVWAAAQFDLLSRMAGSAGATLVEDHRRRRAVTPDDVQAGIETLAEEQERQAEQERQRSGKSA